MTRVWHTPTPPGRRPVTSLCSVARLDDVLQTLNALPVVLRIDLTKKLLVVSGADVTDETLNDFGRIADEILAQGRAC